MDFLTIIMKCRDNKYGREYVSVLGHLRSLLTYRRRCCVAKVLLLARSAPFLKDKTPIIVTPFW